MEQKELTNSMLNDLLSRAKQNDEDAFETLLSRYTPLIEGMTAQFASSYSTVEDREDLRQEAVLGFYRALVHFEIAESRVPFGYYAKECIRNRLISYLRSIKKQEQVRLLSDEEPDVEIEAADENPAAQLIRREAYLDLYETVCKTLSPYENRVWWMYLSGRTAEEIARVVGKDQKSVQNAVYRIRKKLRGVIPTP